MIRGFAQLDEPQQSTLGLDLVSLVSFGLVPKLCLGTPIRQALLGKHRIYSNHRNKTSLRGSRVLPNKYGTVVSKSGFPSGAWGPEKRRLSRFYFAQPR